AVTHVGDVRPQTKVDPGNDAAGALRSPHVDLNLLGYTITDEVDQAHATAYGYTGGPVEITEGNEFFLAIMAPDGVANEDAEARLRVGEKTMKLDRVPGPGEGVAAVTPKDTDVWLEVTDEGKTQSLNLRDGSRED